MTPSVVYSAPVTSVLPSLIPIRELHPQRENLSTVFNLTVILTGNMKFHITRETRHVRVVYNKNRIWNEPTF